VKILRNVRYLQLLRMPRNK